MFKLNDYVVYKRNVCQITEIKKNAFVGKDYYILMPIDDQSLTLSVPVDSKDLLRKIISVDEVKRLVKKIPEIEVIVPENDRLIEQNYKELLNSGNHEDLIKIIKTTFGRNQVRQECGKKSGEKDNNYFNMAEKLLYNEFSIALGLSFDETKEYVIAHVKENENK